MTVITIDTTEWLERLKVDLVDQYYLDYEPCSYDDTLTDEQVQEIFDGKWENLEQNFDDWYYEYRLGNVEQIIEGLIKDAVRDEEDPEAEVVFEAFKHSEDYDELRFAIEERNASNSTFMAFIKNCQSKLMRYSLEFDVEVSNFDSADDIVECMTLMAETLGIDLDDNEDALRSLCIEGGPGHLYVIWYDDPESLIMGTLNAAWGNRSAPDHIAWTDPHLVVLDTMNGSGYETQVQGTVSVKFDGTRLCLDKAKGNGYGWDDVAGVVASGYESDCELLWIEKENHGE